MMALRVCVRRHQRLQILVVDGGPEFQSVYFESLVARYGCTKKTRPGAQPLWLRGRALVWHDQHRIHS